ncbi:MAG TPA: response regulator [Actinobacteria bacterium]|nr:response regulator [Actinomycetota bacterium]
MNNQADILLVENNEDHAFLIMQALKKFENHKDLSVHVVEDGMQALDFVRKKGSFPAAPTPDLILLDIKLPNKNGFEVLASIKCDQQLRSIPVVMLTSSDIEADITHSYSLGCNGFITKPMEVNQLLNKLGNIVAYWVDANTFPPKIR